MENFTIHDSADRSTRPSGPAAQQEAKLPSITTAASLAAKLILHCFFYEKY
jgi:hypothetical protein